MDVNFLIIAWRGFSGNEGSPSEEGLYKDGKSALKWLLEKGVVEKNIVIYGESLGTGVATHLSQNRNFAGVVLEVVEPVVNILLPVFNGIAAAIKLMFEGLTFVAQVLGVIVGIVAVLNAKLIIAAIATMIKGAFESFSKIPFGVGFALASAAALAGVGFIKRLVTGDDVFSAPTNKPGYGDRTLFGPEGAIALNNKDTVIAGTNLFKGNDVVSAPAGAINMNQGNTSSEKTNQLLTQMVGFQKKQPGFSRVSLYEVQ